MHTKKEIMNFLKTILNAVVLIIVMSSCNKKDSIPNENDGMVSENTTNVYPFPNHTNYKGAHIKPTNYNQTDLDFQTAAFYDAWKKTYLKNDCNTNEYYVLSGNGAKTVSEAHGYGMMITCFMAGYDSNAKLYFDGLYHYYKSHPSNINNNLMDWKQISCSDVASTDDDAASDGDIDIAFSLLLAHKQWGSEGAINYLLEGKNMINSILEDEINQNIWTVKLGDWSDSSNPNYYFGTRSSDFITSHFKVFANATNNANWNLVVDECYNLISSIQNNQSTTTGLMPDFIINSNTNPMPAEPNYLEDVYDGNYYYNACRFPWRIGNDYLISGDTRAKTAIIKINRWLKNATLGNANAISNGYQLNGTPINNWGDATFIGPLTVGAMADVTNQDWLNTLYNELVNNNDLSNGDYYSNTIKVLSMITISGNYWNPEI